MNERAEEGNILCPGGFKDQMTERRPGFRRGGIDCFPMDCSSSIWACRQNARHFCKGRSIDFGQRGSRLHGNDEKGHWKTSDFNLTTALGIYQ